MLTLILLVYGYHRDDLNRLEYVGMCIKESLRLFPPVFAIGRETSQDVTFDGHVMPKGVSNNHTPLNIVALKLVLTTPTYF